jgi:hypothetical protein
MSRSMQHAFMWQFVDGAGSRPPRGRCLDWDGWYGGSIFASLCAEVDVLVYAEPFGPGPTKPLPKGSSKVVRWWHADAHTMSRVLPLAAFDLIIANSVFEHLEKPLLAMQRHMNCSDQAAHSSGTRPSCSPSMVCHATIFDTLPRGLD